jgi:alpha-D-ribose 1-methylphosphonate 5-triphosphate diphosphatase
MSETVFRNGRLVLRDGVAAGRLCVRRGRIADVEANGGACRSASRAAGPSGTPGNGAVVDLEGDFLLPGLVELHTDNLESHLMPRPGVVWPSSLAALLSHDAQIAGAGITTVLDSLCVGEPLHGSQRKALLAMALDGLDALDRADAADAAHAGTDGGVSAGTNGASLLRSEHLLHLRCEVADPDAPEILADHLAHPRLTLVSVMDHTPGQRQWTDLDKYRVFHRRQAGDAAFDRAIDEHRARHERHAEENRAAILGLCRERGLRTASHDDTLPEHVRQACAEGIAVSEFPTTLEAARAAHQGGMRVVMGAPNVVRSGSHSGNVSARELARAGFLDVLSSDYLPASLLCAAFDLAREPGVELHEAVAMVTAVPARAVGLADRGELAVGQRADLVRVRMVEDLPVVRGVWRAGRRVC